MSVSEHLLTLLTSSPLQPRPIPVVAPKLAPRVAYYPLTAPSSSLVTASSSSLVTAPAVPPSQPTEESSKATRSPQQSKRQQPKMVEKQTASKQEKQRLKKAKRAVQRMLDLGYSLDEIDVARTVISKANEMVTALTLERRRTRRSTEDRTVFPKEWS